MKKKKRTGGRPKKGYERGMISMPPDAWRELREEAKSRGLTLGEVVHEALQCRVVWTSKG